MRTFYNSAGGFQSIAYTPNGHVLALDNRARLTLWNLDYQRPDRIYSISSSYSFAVLKGFRSTQGHVGIYSLTESPDFIRFDLTTRSKLPWFNPGSGSVTDVSDDGTLALVNEEGKFIWRLWELETNRPLEEYFELPGESPAEFRYKPALSPNNRALAMTVISDQRLLLWHRGDSKPVQLARPGQAQNQRRMFYHFLAFSSDPYFLAGAQIARKGLVTVWDLPDGTVRWSLPQEEFIWALAVHPSGKLLAVATVGGPAGRVVRFLDAANGAEITRFNWNAGRIQCLAFSPDGLTCAAGSSDRRLVVWDVDM